MRIKLLPILLAISMCWTSCGDDALRDITYSKVIFGGFTLTLLPEELAGSHQEYQLRDDLGQIVASGEETIPSLNDFPTSIIYFGSNTWSERIDENFVFTFGTGASAISINIVPSDYYPSSSSSTQHNFVENGMGIIMHFDWAN